MILGKTDRGTERNSNVHNRCATHAFEGKLVTRDVSYKLVGLNRAQARGFGYPIGELRRMVVEPAPLGLGSGQLHEGWHGTCFGTILGTWSRFVIFCICATVDCAKPIRVCTLNGKRRT